MNVRDITVSSFIISSLCVQYRTICTQTRRHKKVLRRQFILLVLLSPTSLCQARGLVPVQLMLSFLQKEGVQGLASLFNNSAAILLLSITAEPVNKGNNNTNMDRGKYVISRSQNNVKYIYEKKSQILRQLIAKLTFTQRCSLIYFASEHLYCDTNDLENIYSISY